MPPQQSKSAPDFIPYTPDFIPADQSSGAPNAFAPVDARNDFQRGFDTLTQHQEYTPVHSLGDLGKNAVTAASNFGGGVIDMARPLVHPLDTVKGLVTPQKFNPATLLGPAGMMADSLAKEVMAGRGAEALPGVALLAAGGPEAVDTGEGAITKLRDPLKAYRSPAIAPHEAAARATADVLTPGSPTYRANVNTLSEHLPAIRDFGRSTRNPFKTPLDFSKAATGAGREASAFFNEHFIDPNADIETPGGTIGQIHQRLGEINDRLRPAYNMRTAGAEMTAAERSLLEAERDALNQHLYSTLSYRSGLPESEVQGINQRGGALQGLGDQADAAQAMRRGGISGYTPTGMPIPFTGIQRAMRLVDYLRGGPEAVAGRKLGRILEQPMDEAPRFPDPEAMARYRQMADKEGLGALKGKMQTAESNQAASEARKPEGMGPTQPPGPPVELNPENYLRNKQMRNNMRQTVQRAKAENVTGGNRPPVFAVESTPPVLTPRLKALLERRLPTR